MKSRLDKKYRIVKFVCIALGALTIPLSTYIGFLLGAGNYSLAVFLCCLEIVVVFVDTTMWAWCLERMTE